MEPREVHALLFRVVVRIWSPSPVQEAAAAAVLQLLAGSDAAAQWSSSTLLRPGDGASGGGDGTSGGRTGDRNGVVLQVEVYARDAEAARRTVVDTARAAIGLDPRSVAWIVDARNVRVDRQSP